MLNLFSKKSIGLDIADHTIEMVEVTKKGGTLEISSLGRVLLEPGIVSRGRIKNKKKLTEALKQIFLKAKPRFVTAKKVIFGLPESQVYVHILKLEPHRRNERDNLVLKEAQSNIPLKNEDLLFSYKVLDEGKDRVEILLVAVSKEMVQEWQQFFQKLELEVELFDIESLATFRSLFSKPPTAPVCLVDIGAATTNIAIFDKKGLRSSYSINIAGKRFTQEIAKALKIEPEEAEIQKRKTGLSDKDSQIFPVLVKALEPVNKEIKTLLDYFEEKNEQKIKEIILVGGSSKLEGIADYFKTNLNLPVRLGKTILFKKLALEYIEAVGLALRGLNKKWSQRDPVIYIKTKAKKVSKKKQKEELMPVSEIEEEPALASIAQIERKKKLRFQKILLLTILIIGVTVIGLAYWYRSHEKTQKEEELKSQAVQYTKTQSFDLKVPVAVYTEEYTSDRVKGRIIENTQEWAGGYGEAVAHSRIAVEKGLEEGEKLWLTPISPEQTVFPMAIKWLVYSEKDANKLFLEEIDKLNKDKVDYLLNNIEKNNLEPTENLSIFYLLGKVTISLNQLIEMEEKKEPPKEEIVEKIQMILIEETGVGWLYVRKGPNTTYGIWTKVYPGESYPLLEESAGWYKIELEDGSKGWVFSEYSSKEE